MATKHWALDLAHSNINFKIRHLLISSIAGSFKVFSGSMVTPVHDDFNDAFFTLIIDAYSIETNNRERDEHLKSPDFFSADYYPQIEFRSTHFKHIDGDKYKLTGGLTIKGITKEVTLDVLFGGQAKDGFGISRAGFEISGTINRNDFGIHSGSDRSLVIGEEIVMEANIQFTNEA